MKKKAQLSVQFNWIFILIIGAIILAFFIVVIRAQTKTADFELAGDIMKNLETVVKSAEMNPGLEKKISTPDITITFSCEGEVSSYDLGNGISRDMPYDAIFAPSKLSGNEIISWTQEWDVPMKAGLFQYLANKNTKFYIVDDAGTLAEKLNDSLPRGINKQIITSSYTIPFEGYESYKIVTFGTAVPARDPRIKSTSVIDISGITNDLDSKGTITFQSETGTPTKTYVKQAMLFGAIFSDNSSYYECTVNKSIKRLRTIMNLTESRTKMLKQEISNSDCQKIYGWAITSISDVLLATANTVNYDTIYTQSENIKRRNEQLMRENNCPLIY